MSEKLRRAREQAGLTLQQLATKAGVSRPTVEKAETGSDRIRYAYAARIVNALNALADTSFTVESLEIKTVS